MTSLLVLLAGLQAHDLRNCRPARDASKTTRTTTIPHQTFIEQQNAIQAAASTHYSHARRWWAALTAHATQRTRTHARASTTATTTGYHRHPQPGTLKLSVRTTPDRADPQPASTAALHTPPLSRRKPTASAPDREREEPPRAPRTNAPAQKHMSADTAQQETTTRPEPCKYFCKYSD